jgi:hypothetical protein
LENSLSIIREKEAEIRIMEARQRVLEQTMNASLLNDLKQQDHKLINSL